MNKQGSVMIYAIMVGLVILILALALAPSVVQFTSSAMNSSSGDTIGLDCNNESISNFDKATCIATDSISFYFVGILIFVAGAFLTAKVIFA